MPLERPLTSAPYRLHAGTQMLKCSLRGALFFFEILILRSLSSKKVSPRLFLLLTFFNSVYLVIQVSDSNDDTSTMGSADRSSSCICFSCPSCPTHATRFDKTTFSPLDTVHERSNPPPPPGATADVAMAMLTQSERIMQDMMYVCVREGRWGAVREVRERDKERL
jgi:hypothetical protein